MLDLEKESPFWLCCRKESGSLAFGREMYYGGPAPSANDIQSPEIKTWGSWESMSHPRGQSRAFLHCNILLIEYHHGPTDFNGTSSLSKNNIYHLEIIKMRRSEITDTLLSPQKTKLFFFTWGKTPPIPVNLFTKLLALVLHDKKLKLKQRLSGVLREHTKHVVIIGFHRNEWLGFF